MVLAGDLSGDHETFSKMGGAQDHIQPDLLGLITADLTNIKFQMDATEGSDQWQVSACSAAVFLDPAHAPPMRRLWWVAMEPSTWRPPERNEPVPGYLRDQGERAAGRTPGFRSTSVVEPSSYPLLLAGMLGLAGVSFARRLATQKA